MMQRFSKNEMKKFSFPKLNDKQNMPSAGELRLHSWFTGEPNDLNRKGQSSIDGNVSVILSLKELLNVSSDWMDVKNSHK